MEKSRKIIHKRIDNELSKTETRFFKKKVLEDSKKREEYNGLKKVVDTSRRVKKVKPPSGLSKKVVKKIRESGK